MKIRRSGIVFLSCCTACLLLCYPEPTKLERDGLQYRMAVDIGVSWLITLGERVGPISTIGISNFTDIGVSWLMRGEGGGNVNHGH